MYICSMRYFYSERFAKIGIIADGKVLLNRIEFLIWVLRFLCFLLYSFSRMSLQAWQATGLQIGFLPSGKYFFRIKKWNENNMLKKIWTIFLSGLSSLISVATFSVAIFSVATFSVAIFPVAIFSVAIFSVAIFSVSWTWCV